MWSKLADVVKQTAPLLGTVLAGSGGHAVGKLVANVLGTPEHDEDAAIAVVSANPDKLVELRKLELAHKMEFERIQLEEARLEMQDRDSARRRNVEQVNVTGRADYNMVVLGWLIVLGFFVTMAILFWKGLPESGGEIVYMMFGTLTAAFTAVVAYYFGSSAGSKAKDAKLARG